MIFETKEQASLNWVVLLLETESVINNDNLIKNQMTRRRRIVAVILTSATAATVALNRFIHRREEDKSDLVEDDLALKTFETKFHLTDDLLKNKGENSYISIESTNALTTRYYHQALQYLKQTHSTNPHIRERGLSHLAKLSNLSPTYYSIIGQQLDYHSAIQLARTYEADSNLFPIGPPYILSIGNEKILATDNVDNVNDDDVLLHTIRQFLEKLIDEKNRPLDILSHHYLQLVRNFELKDKN